MQWKIITFEIKIVCRIILTEKKLDMNLYSYYFKKFAINNELQF